MTYRLLSSWGDPDGQNLKSHGLSRSSTQGDDSIMHVSAQRTANDLRAEHVRVSPRHPDTPLPARPASNTSNATDVERCSPWVAAAGQKGQQGLADHQGTLVSAREG